MADEFSQSPWRSWRKLATSVQSPRQASDGSSTFTVPYQATPRCWTIGVGSRLRPHFPVDKGMSSNRPPLSMRSHQKKALGCAETGSSYLQATETVPCASLLLRAQRGIRVTLALFTLAVAAAESYGQTDTPHRFTRTATVTPISDPIIIDGVLDEAVWTKAPRIGNLIQQQPLEGQSPTERTDVTLLHDANYLYVGVLAYDSEPENVIGTQMSRDANLNSDDRIEILLDTFRDQRNAFYFATNPSGAHVDGLLSSGEQLNINWDSIWHVRTRRSELGWVAEFAIPFKSLSFPAKESVWGFNITRKVYRKLEDIRWSGARHETAFLQVAEAGKIEGLHGLKQGLGLDVRPFIAGNWLHTEATGENTVKVRPGLDVFYNITPSLKLTGTINTDFGETEVDARQINLSRFSLFLPEKRSFFLEDAGVFNFASIGPLSPGGIAATGADVFPFFSRQIGLLGGQEVPIDAGLKLTGKTGQIDLGLLGVRTRATSFVEGKTFLVGRFKQNLFEQSYVGAIFTEGHPAPGMSGQTFGADLHLATSRFLVSRNLVFDAYGAKTMNQGPGGDDWSYGFGARYPNDKFDAQIALREIPRDFQPGLGFVQRSNVRMLRAGASYNPRPRLFNIQQAFHDIYYTQFQRLDTGQIESWDLYIAPTDWHFSSGDGIHAIADPNWVYERLFEPFVIAPGVVLPAGEYRFIRFKSVVTTATKRRLSGSVIAGWGDYWSGTAETLNTSLTYKLPPWFTFTLSANQTFAHLPEGDFIARILTSTINYAVSPFLSFSNLIQYDNRSRNLGWQSRIRWTLQPGRDLFLVVSQGWLQDPTGGLRFTPEDSKVSTKFQYTFRY